MAEFLLCCLMNFEKKMERGKKGKRKEKGEIKTKVEKGEKKGRKGRRKVGSGHYCKEKK